MASEYLLTPGPTPVPDSIQKEMSKPIIHHRTPQYREIFQGVNKSLKSIFKTKGEVITLTASGTGAMEASVVNTLSPGDTAIVVRGGKFGERFAEICSAYGVKVIPVDIEWGTAPEPERIRKSLNDHRETNAVFMSLCETSTATVYDVKAIAEITNRTDAILVVDAISGLGADECNMDEWNVDVVVGGSQKGLMIPPGLAFIALSDKAWKKAATSRLPRYYYDLKKYKKQLEKSDVPFTPAITLVIGLEKALSLIEAEGVDTYIRRHREDADFVRAAINEMGLTLFSKSPSQAVTGVRIPEGVNGDDFIKALKAKAIRVAGGQAALKGKIFRIAHMGGITRKDLEHALSVIKETVKR